MADLSDCLARFAPSRISEIWDLAQKKIANGEELFDLSCGEPDFDTDSPVKQAAHQAIDNGYTKYTSTDGAPDLKAAIRARLIRQGHPSYPDECLAVGNGAKPLIAHLLMALLNPGDEVIIPTPCWTSHKGMVLAFAGKPVYVRTDIEQGYKINAAQLRAALTHKTRVLILCTPSNPTAVSYTHLRAHET